VSAKNKATLLEANAAISKLDLEGFLSFCAEDLKWTMVGAQAMEGKQTIRKWMRATYVVAPIFDVKTLVAEGDLLVALGDISVEDQKGNVTRSSYCDVWRFRDGLMAELQAYVVQIASTAGA
jgi:uncharacterized protein